MKSITELRTSFRSLAVLAMLAVFTLPAGAITFGQPDGNRHPNAGVIIIHHNIPGVPNPFVHCSGILVHERVFLTAGHCADGLQSLIDSGLISMDQLFVTFNRDPYVVSDWRPTSNLAAHLESSPQYENLHDIGAVILAEPVRGIRPARLAPVEFLEQKTQPELVQGNFTVVGYGWDLEFAPPAPTTEDRTRRFATPQFINLLGNIVLMQQNGNAGNSGINDWDSGSPLFWTDAITGDDTLIAITIFGDRLRIAYSGFYRLDTDAASTFIQSVVQGLR